MNTNQQQTNIVNTVQDYICKNVIPHPHIYFLYLSELYQQMQQKQISLTPLGLLEYYNLKINFQIKATIDRRKQTTSRRHTSKVA